MATGPQLGWRVILASILLIVMWLCVDGCHDYSTSKGDANESLYLSYYEGEAGATHGDGTWW